MTSSAITVWPEQGLGCSALLGPYMACTTTTLISPTDALLAIKPIPCLDCFRRFVLQQPLVASAVTGATDTLQLEMLLRAACMPPLRDETLMAINAIHNDIPNPTP